MSEYRLNRLLKYVPRNARVFPLAWRRLCFFHILKLRRNFVGFSTA